MSDAQMRTASSTTCSLHGRRKRPRPFPRALTAATAAAYTVLFTFSCPPPTVHARPSPPPSAASPSNPNGNPWSYYDGPSSYTPGRPNDQPPPPSASRPQRAGGGYPPYLGDEEEENERRAPGKVRNRRPLSASTAGGSSLPMPREGAAWGGVGRRRDGRERTEGFRYQAQYLVEEEEETFVEGMEGQGEGQEGPEAGPADPVDLYCARWQGRMAVTLAAGVSGAGLGLGLSASAIHRPASCALAGLGLGLFLSLLRNDFGDLFRALGLLLIYLVERQASTGTAYPALHQLRPLLRLAPRRPFPPVENPWAYVRASPSDVEFSMTQTLAALVFVGAFLGYLLAHFISLFFLPAWLLALAGGGLGGYTATLRDRGGDMARCLGMKLVAVLGLVRALEQELLVWRKLGKVFHISYGHAAALDARWKVREKMWRVGTWVGGMLNQEAERVRGDMGEGGGEGGGGGPARGYGFAHPTYREEVGEYWEGGGGGGGRGERPPPENPSWRRE